MIEALRGRMLLAALELGIGFQDLLMSISKLSALRDVLFAFEDDLQEKAVLVCIAPDEMVGVQPTPEFYDDNGDERNKIVITVECENDACETDDDLAEEISDAVSDRLRSRGLGDIASSIRIDA
jgi:hypothetical protein